MLPLKECSYNQHKKMCCGFVGFFYCQEQEQQEGAAAAAAVSTFPICSGGHTAAKKPFSTVVPLNNRRLQIAVL